jgi:hypothetical protein
MRFFFHISDRARDTFNPDWNGRDFDDVESALAHAQSLGSELAEDGYIIVSDKDAVKVGVVGG